MKDAVIVSAFFIGFATGFVGFLVVFEPAHAVRSQAVRHGCAIYTDTGEFAWKDEVTTGTMKRKEE
jgi:hypothetical protein